MKDLDLRINAIESHPTGISPTIFTSYVSSSFTKKEMTVPRTTCAETEMGFNDSFILLGKVASVN